MYLYYHGHLSATWCRKVSPWANKMLLRGSIWSHWLKTKNGNSMWVMHLLKYSTTFAFSQWQAWHQMFGPCWVSLCVTGRLLKPTPQLTMMDIKVILDSETIAAHGYGFDGEELARCPFCMCSLCCGQCVTLRAMPTTFSWIQRWLSGGYVVYTCKMPAVVEGFKKIRVRSLK